MLISGTGQLGSYGLLTVVVAVSRAAFLDVDMTVVVGTDDLGELIDARI